VCLSKVAYTPGRLKNYRWRSRRTKDAPELTMVSALSPLKDCLVGEGSCRISCLLKKSEINLQQHSCHQVVSTLCCMMPEWLDLTPPEHSQATQCS
jgi:hypothetical protein